MRVLCLLLILLMPTLVQAKTLVFDLRSGPGVVLQKVDVEESGAVYEGNRSGVTIETSRGEKIFRAIITADVEVYPQEVASRQAYYNRFQFLGSGRNRHGYRIRDVVRIPINVVNGGTVDFKIHFDPLVPGLTYEHPNGGIVAIERMIRFQDNQHFGIIPPTFSGSGSTSPRSVCVEQRTNPQNPMIVECVRWENQ